MMVSGEVRYFVSNGRSVRECFHSPLQRKHFGRHGQTAAARSWCVLIDCIPVLYEHELWLHRRGRVQWALLVAFLICVLVHLQPAAEISRRINSMRGVHSVVSGLACTSRDMFESMFYQRAQVIDCAP